MFFFGMAWVVVSALFACFTWTGEHSSLCLGMSVFFGLGSIGFFGLAAAQEIVVAIKKK